MSESNDFSDTPIGDRIQQVLARAAQGQADEQQQQVSALEQIQQRLSSLESALQGVRERETSNSDRLDALASQLDQIARQEPPDWAQRLGEDLDALRDQIKPITELSSVPSDVRGLVDGLDTALQKIDTLTETAEQSAPRFDELCQRLDQLQTSADTAAANIARLDQTLSNVNERTERALEALEQRMEQELERLGNRVEGTTSRIEGRVNAFQGRLDSVDDRITWVNERLDHLPETLQTTELHRRLSELAQRRVPYHGEQLASLDERLREAESQLIETIEGLGEDVRARPGRQEVEEMVTNIVDSAREQAAGRLSALEESVVALAEALFDRGVETAPRTATRSPAPAAGSSSKSRSKSTTKSSASKKES